MSISLAQMELQARALPADERARLAEVILESLQDTTLPEIEADWQREIALRVAAYDKGEILTYQAVDVFAEAKRIAQ